MLLNSLQTLRCVICQPPMPQKPYFNLLFNLLLLNNHPRNYRVINFTHCVRLYLTEARRMHASAVPLYSDFFHSLAEVAFVPYPRHQL